MKIKKFNSKEEWLQERFNGIGSSDVPAILGVSPFVTPYQLWEYKKGYATQEENKYMRAGTKLEKVVAEMFFEETGYQNMPEFDGFVIVQSDEYPFLIASPDRIYTNDIKIGLLEIKTTQKSIQDIELLLPQYWVIQVTYQYGIMKDMVDEAYIAYLSNGVDFGYKKFEFNEELFNFIVEKCKEFYDKYIIGDDIPDISPQDVERVYKKSIPDSFIEADDTVYELVSKLKKLKIDKKELEEEIESLEKEIKFRMKDSEAILYNGDILATWKSINSSPSFNVKEFQKQYPELYNQFLVEPKPIRQFRIK